MTLVLKQTWTGGRDR